MVSVPNDLKVDNNDSNLLAFKKNDLNDLYDKTGQGEFLQIIDAQIPHFVEPYNRDKNLFDERAISTVIETQESVENRLAGFSKAIFLSNTNRGKYWIVEENGQYFLVPHAKININEHNKYTIENLFDYDESNSSFYDFRLLQPAKIVKTNSELWQLQEKGKLEFF